MTVNPPRILHQADVEAVMEAKHLALETDEAPARGLSAYEVAVAEGFVGDAVAWLLSLVGPTGPTGPGIFSTTDALIDITNPINTTDKYAGKLVYNTTLGLPVWAFGPETWHAWYKADQSLGYAPS